MGESKINRLRLEESDFPILEKMVNDLHSQIIESFPLSILENSNWPLRYEYKHSETHSFEFIFSSMGSFTVRISKSERYRKNPPPIFYVSVGKYSPTDYLWEDLNAEIVIMEKESLKLKILSAIEKFTTSIVL